jgi:hypothetical protein
MLGNWHSIIICWSPDGGLRRRQALVLREVNEQEVWKFLVLQAQRFFDALIHK